MVEGAFHKGEVNLSPVDEGHKLRVVSGAHEHVLCRFVAQVLGEKGGSFKRYRIKPPKGAECAVISFCRRASRISFAPSAPRQEAGASA